MDNTKMTIGSDFNYPADIATKLHRKKRSAKSKWTATFPNPPDLCFDYRTLVEQKTEWHKQQSPVIKSV